jgi:hypothetical protein
VRTVGISQLFTTAPRGVPGLRSDRRFHAAGSYSLTPVCVSSDDRVVGGCHAGGKECPTFRAPTRPPCGGVRPIHGRPALRMVSAVGVGVRAQDLGGAFAAGGQKKISG